VASLTFLLFLSALAPADSVVVLPGIEVRDVRPFDDPALRRAPGFARSYDVAPLRGRIGTVSDVLARGVGMHVRQYGGLGSFSAVSIRGSSSAQVAYTLDGAPLNPPQYGVVNASDLPIEALSRVEVYRGAAPLGFDAPGGGAVELVTRTDPGAWAHADLGAGSFGTSKLDGAGGFAHARTSGLLVVQRLLSDGDFPYLDDNATDSNADDDTLKTRVNNAFDLSSLTARLSQGAGPLELSILHDRLAKKQGVPGTGANTWTRSSLTTDRGVTTLRAAAPPWLLTPVLSAFYATQRDRLKDPAGELMGAKQDNDDLTTRYGGRAEATVLPFADNTLALLAEGRRERYEPSMNLPKPRTLPVSKRELVYLGAEDRWTHGRLGLAVQARREVSFDAFPAGPAYPGALPSPAVERTTRLTRWSAGARYELVQGLALKGSVAQLARIPTLEELFGNRGTVHGNRDAKPERVLTRDAGLIASYAPAGGGAKPRALEAQLSAYRSDADDLLVWIANSANSSVAQNVDAARLEGVELSARAAWAFGLSADASWTRQWTRDEGEAVYWYGKDLPGRPAHEASLGAALQRGPVRGFGEVHAMSKFWLDRYNQRAVPARTLVDLGATFAFAEGTTDVVVECRNVGDVHAQDFAGYPLPGRSWALGVRFHLDRKAGLP
jgi:iron complex outermembrane receptor protein